MESSKAKELEKLQLLTAAYKRRAEFDQKRKQIDTTDFMNAALKQQALLELKLAQIAAHVEDMLRIRRELIPRSPGLQTPYEQKQFESRLHEFISGQFG